MKIIILGKVWELLERSEAEDSRLKDCDGYCDWTVRQMIVEREMQGSLIDMEVYIRKVKRHEIVHAFLCECGLNECSSPSDAWARNEELVDWVARMGPEIYEAWKAADALDPVEKPAEAPCPFCKGKGLKGENFYSMELQIITPLPAICLTDGTVEKSAPPPYAESAIFDENRELIDSFTIRYCPCCGRKIHVKE